MIEKTPEIDTTYSEKEISETEKYIAFMKMNNRKGYNKYRKQGRKFSDNIMKKLKW